MLNFFSLPTKAEKRSFKAENISLTKGAFSIIRLNSILNGRASILCPIIPTNTRNKKIITNPNPGISILTSLELNTFITQSKTGINNKIEEIRANSIVVGWERHHVVFHITYNKRGKVR